MVPEASLCFSGDWHGIIGNFHNAFLRGVDLTTASPNNTIPMFVFIAYQMMFAIITPALISGAFTNRVTFKAYMLFLTGWLTFVYFPFVHMVWGGGFLQKWGVLDFAGGIVVHNIAGVAALASVLYVGKRHTADRGPHSIPLVALGTGLLWFGWYGFNAGSEMRVDSVTATAFLNTDLAASFAAVAWLFVAWINEKKPKLLGLLTGAVAGLATVIACESFHTSLDTILPARKCEFTIFCDVFFPDLAIPDSLGINNNERSVIAQAKATAGGHLNVIVQSLVG
jgi:ammonium transporter, Amt family